MPVNLERDEIIQSAMDLCEGNDKYQRALTFYTELYNAKGSGRFEGIHEDDLIIAVAIQEIGMNGFADQVGGSTEYGLHGMRVGRYVLWTDNCGFLSFSGFINEQCAIEAIEEEDAKIPNE